jgi:hypothetical protein
MGGGGEGFEAGGGRDGGWRWLQLIVVKYPPKLVKFF